MVQLRSSAFLSALICLFLSACGESTSAHASADPSAESLAFNQCLESIEADSERYIENLEKNYKRIDRRYFNGIPDENKSFLLRGEVNRGAVLLFHGILSSPDALRKLALEFNRKGLTVLAPLISAFGSTVAVANASSVKTWQQSVDYHAQSLSRCFKNFALVGFSLGGALATDFTLNRYPKLLEEKKVSQLNSLLLLSPAIRPAEKMVSIKAGVTLLFTDAVPFWFISYLKDDPDIKEMMKQPEKHNQYFPVRVGTSLHELSKLLKTTKKRFKTHSLPVSLDYSQADSATDWDETRKFLTDSFFDVRIFSYSQEEAVPHSLFLKDDHWVGDQIRKGLASFISRYAQSP